MHQVISYRRRTYWMRGSLQYTRESLYRQRRPYPTEVLNSAHLASRTIDQSHQTGPPVRVPPMDEPIGLH
jgi:hypothetical protein